MCTVVNLGYASMGKVSYMYKKKKWSEVMYSGIRSKCSFDMSLITGSNQKYFILNLYIITVTNTTFRWGGYQNLC